MHKVKIKSILGKLLFEYEVENNTVLKTLQEANLQEANLQEANLQEANLYGADLYGANLQEANLQEAKLYGADLRGADLRGADLYGANLYGANLQEANLQEANLQEAKLYGADLRGADLRGANLRGANLQEAKNIEEATLPMFCKWGVGIKGDSITIGCKTKSLEEWDAFFASSEEYDTKRGSGEFKRIQAVYEGHKAYINFLKCK